MGKAGGTMVGHCRARFIPENETATTSVNFNEYIRCVSDLYPVILSQDVADLH